MVDFILRSDSSSFKLKRENISKIGGMLESFIDFGGSEEFFDDINIDIDIIAKIYSFTPITIEEFTSKRELIRYYSIPIEKINFEEFDMKEEIIFGGGERMNSLFKTEDLGFLPFKILIGDGTVNQDCFTVDFDFNPLWFSMSDWNNILVGNGMNTLHQIQCTDIDEIFDSNHSFINFWSENTKKRVRDSPIVSLFSRKINSFTYGRWCSQLNFRLEFCRKDLNESGIEIFSFESDLEDCSPMILEIPHDSMGVKELDFFSIDREGKSFIPLSKTEKVLKYLKERNVLPIILEKFKKEALVTDRKKKFFEDVLEGTIIEMNFNNYYIEGFIKMNSEIEE